jgi:hypothetical protein
MKSGSKGRTRPSQRKKGCGDLGGAPRVRHGNQGQVASDDDRGRLRSGLACDPGGGAERFRRGVVRSQ